MRDSIKGLAAETEGYREQGTIDDHVRFFFVPRRTVPPLWSQGYQKRVTVNTLFWLRSQLANLPGTNSC